MGLRQCFLRGDADGCNPCGSEGDRRTGSPSYWDGDTVRTWDYETMFVGVEILFRSPHWTIATRQVVASCSRRRDRREEKGDSRSVSGGHRTTFTATAAEHDLAQRLSIVVCLSIARPLCVCPGERACVFCWQNCFSAKQCLPPTGFGSSGGLLFFQLIVRAQKQIELPLYCLQIH